MLIRNEIAQCQTEKHIGTKAYGCGFDTLRFVLIINTKTERI